MTREEQKAIAAKMRRDGLTYKAIGEAFGVSRTAIKYWLDPDHREYGKRWRVNNRERVNKRERELKRKRLAENNFEYLYRVALVTDRCRAKKRGYAPCTATVQQLIEAYTGYCDCCGRHESQFKKRLAIDHCHDTGNFRGFLCQCCNHAIGLLRDNPGDILNYLAPAHAQILLQALAQ
jgi:hypothetical protein